MSEDKNPDPADYIYAVTCDCSWFGMRDECLRGECPDCGGRVKRDAAQEGPNSPTVLEGGEMMSEIRIVFDGPPGPEPGRFVEVETEDGKSTNFGEWREGPDGYWYLVVPDHLTELARLKEEHGREVADRNGKIKMLVGEILDAAVVGGLLDKDWSSLTGPEAIMLCQDMGKQLAALRAENTALADCLNGSSKAVYTAEMYDKLRAERDELTADNITLRAERDALKLYHNSTHGYESAREIIIKNLEAERDELKDEIKRMKEHTWCAYCGLEIHIDDEAATKISEHIMSCEKHPIHIALADNITLRNQAILLKEYIDTLIRFVPEGWEMPLGYSRVVRQIEEGTK